ncbi:TonB-dependent receptor [Pseudomonas sp. LJDD11]|uniref:TonB-dependent siderophore receptor n=1 Tax=Pseudomonas sp. LJDD11 TaxID=2931984 RepID=UPI00211BD624|nr:TonB-dependent receptor [Pseudomonas sp. LJDD11]MCQ9427310.1 TonB-dependent receptor [Pseudomonas sp. LJDD11]
MGNNGSSPRLSQRLSLLAAALLMAGTAMAQDTAYQLDIAPQALDQALNALAGQTGSRILFATDIAEGRQAQGLKASLTVEQALQRLVSGSELRVQKTGDGSYLVSRPKDDEVMELSSVTISGKAPGSITEGTGSYATRSSSSSTRLNLSSLETPQSITVITRQRIDDQKLDNLTDLAQATAGINVFQGSYGADGPSLYARGVVINNFQIDGVPTSSGLSNYLQSTAIYDRVEVVRGATGMMSGLGSPAATFNMIRKRPTFEPQTSLTLEAGSWDRYGATLDTSGPLNKEATIRGRLVASYKDKNSWIDNFKQEESVLYGIGEFDLSDRTLLTLGFSNQVQNNKNPLYNGALLYFNNGQKTHATRSNHITIDWTYYDHNLSNAFASIEHRFDSGWSAKSELSHSWYEYDGMIARLTGSVNQQTGAGAYVQPQGRWQSEPKQTNFDTYITGPLSLFDREHEIITGVTLSKIEEASPGYGGSLTAGSGYDGYVTNIYTWDGQAPDPNQHTKTSKTTRDEYQYSAYLSARFRLSDDTNLVMGGRVTDWKRDRDLLTYSSGATSAAKNRETGVFIPYLGLLQNINENWAVYGSYTKIFQPQGHWVRDINNSPLDPEEGTSYEVGIKASSNDESITSSLALFKTEQDNLAVWSGGAYTTKSGTKTQGVEFELSGEIAEGWQVSSGYSYSVITDSTDSRINTFLPRHSLKTFTSYRLPGTLENLTIGGGINWQSKTGENLSAFTQESYALLNLMAKYKFSENITGTLNINNVFNKEYIVGYGGGSAYGFFGDPRSFITSMKYQF